MTGRPALVDLPLLGLSALLLFTLWSPARDLWNPNEPLYGQATAEMAARGEWLVPSVNGRPFGEKPILYFWLALAAAGVGGGVDELTLRLPSAVSGAAIVVLVYVLASGYVGRRRAWISAATVATLFIVFWSARTVQMDLLLTACCLAAIVAATRVIDHGMNPVAGWSLAGLASGLGVASKGPVGLICPALVVGAYLLATRRAGAVVRPAVLAGAGACLVAAAPWYLALAIRGETAVLHEVLVRQNFLRFVEPWDHQGPWWYYLLYFWIDMAPWSLFVPLAWGLRPRGDGERRLHALCWPWIAAIVVFFSLSASKRSPYILPVAPAVALLVAGVAERWLEGTLDRMRERVASVLAALVAVAFGVTAAWLATTTTAGGAVVEAAARATAATLVAASVAILAALLASGRRRFVPQVLLASVTAVYLVAAAIALPAANAFKSHRPVAEAIRLHVGDAPLRGFHEWGWRASYSYYLGRPIPNLESPEQLRKYWTSGERVFLLVERGRLDDVRRWIGDVDPIGSWQVGHNEVQLFAGGAWRPTITGDSPGSR